MSNPLNKNARKETHLTQEKLADLLGVSRDSIHEWENGIRPIPSNMLIKYAKICNVSTDYLLGLTNCRNIENSLIHKKIGLTEESISMLESHVALQDNAKIKTLDFLLRKNHTKAIPTYFSGKGIKGANDLGLLNLIAHYLIDDENKGVENLPCITSIVNGGSGLEIDGKRLTKGVLLSMITETLVEYKQELANTRKNRKRSI